MKNLLTCLLAAVTISGYAQTSDQVLVKVKYNLRHHLDTADKSEVYEQQMLLATGKNASLFTSTLKIAQAQRMLSMMNQGPSMSSAVGVSSTSASSSTRGAAPTSVPSLPDYYYFFSTQKSFTREQLIKDYLVEEAIPKINWQISNETKSLGSIHCQKATARFKGRNWIAWYAPELPFQSGPWKLNGLPGLILEAYDEKKEVQFSFAGIEKVMPNNLKPNEAVAFSASIPKEIRDQMIQMEKYLGNNIILPDGMVKTDLKSIKRLKDAMEKDPEGFMKAHAQSGGNAPMMMNMAGSMTIGNAVKNP
ncbi:MAG: GLPGLI family protein, partial [Bacteroidia bacterium]